MHRAMAPPPTRPALYSLHGHGVSLLVEPPALRDAALAVLVDHAEGELPFAPAAEGCVLHFDESDVMRHVSADAVPVVEGDAAYHPLYELFRSRDGGRWWVVDERWGLCEIDLVRRSWRAYVLPEPGLDAVRLFEAAVMWPLAQLLRPRGLHLVPAASLAVARPGREPRGILILGGDAGPEVRAARDHDLRVVGQRWTALREADGGLELLALPGRTELGGRWHDAAAGNACRRATADLLLLAGPMRRGRASAVPVDTGAARRLVANAWPIPRLGASGTNDLAATLARRCRVHRAHLARDGGDLCRLLVGDRPARRAA